VRFFYHLIIVAGVNIHYPPCPLSILGIKLTPSTNLEELELRARKVMKRLNFTPSLLEHHFKQKGFIGAEGCRITRTNRQLISLGRALVMNPEVLIVHKPDCLFSDSFSEILIKVFREFVDNRGVCMPPESEEPLVRCKSCTCYCYFRAPFDTHFSRDSSLL
jgi:hypothetical protein